MRVVGIIIKDGQVLLMHRFKRGREYWVFPGGGVERGENAEQALIREIGEETSFKVKIDKLLFKLENQFKKEYGGNVRGDRVEHYFLIKDFSGEMALGSPEKERMNENNQYHLEWVELSKIKEIPTLYPKEAVRKVLELVK